MEDQPDSALAPSFPSHFALPGHRCLRSRMGSSAVQSEAVGSLDARGTTFTFQSKRNAGCVVRIRRSLSAPSRIFDTERQPNSSCVLTKRWGYEVGAFDGNYLQNFQFIGSVQYSHRSSLHSRPLQRRSRSVVTFDSSTRMAPSIQNYVHNFCEMGPSSNRSVCLSDSSRCPSLRYAECERPAGTSLRRIQSGMALFPSMGIPASISNSPGITASQLGNGNIFGCSTEIDQGILAARLEESRSESSFRNTELRPSSDRRSNESTTSTDTRHVFGGMAMWGWTECLIGWSDRQKRFLQKSWRDSTLTTYKVAWQKWCAWAKANFVPINHPTGADFC